MRIDKCYKIFMNMIGGMMAGLIIANLFAALTLAVETIDLSRLEKEVLKLELEEMRNAENCY